VKEVTQPPPPEVKMFNRLIAVAIVMLLIGVAIGAVVGWSIGQSLSQAVQSEYTRVKVLNGTTSTATLDNYTYDFFYSNYLGFPQPMRINVEGFGIEKTLTPTQGQTYRILGIEVVVSEVHDDYIILLVKPL
jgi:hypothetical protein